MYFNINKDREAIDRGMAGLAVKHPRQDQQSPKIQPKKELKVGAIAGGQIDIEKKIKGVSRKLKQIQDLKEKLEDGQPLELTQLSKIETEPLLLKEVLNIN
jgi:translation initiation factor 2A